MEVTLRFDRALVMVEWPTSGSTDPGSWAGSVHIFAWTAGGTFTVC